MRGSAPRYVTNGDPSSPRLHACRLPQWVVSLYGLYLFLREHALFLRAWPRPLPSSCSPATAVPPAFVNLAENQYEQASNLGTHDYPHRALATRGWISRVYQCALTEEETTRLVHTCHAEGTTVGAALLAAGLRASALAVARGRYSPAHTHPQPQRLSVPLWAFVVADLRGYAHKYVCTRGSEREIVCVCVLASE
jgi:hypothetical protein